VRGQIEITKEILVFLLTILVIVGVSLILSQRFLYVGDSGSKTEYEEYIREASLRYHVEDALIKAVIMAESSFNPREETSYRDSEGNVKSSKGLMQLTDGLVSDLGNPRTRVGRHCNLKITDVYDPRQNIMGGTCYLSYLLLKYHNNKELAVAAYNCGPGNIDRAVSSHGGSWREIESHLNNYCRPETRVYVPRVMGYYEGYKKPGGSWITWEE